MRVLLSPSVRSDDEAAATVAERLAGHGGRSLRIGLSKAAFRRRLSSYEIHVIRAAILGIEPDSYVRADDGPPTVVGYVCEGALEPRSSERMVVAVTDHVDLAWRSPLAGANDHRLGPRFPVTAGMYEPGPAVQAARLLGVVPVVEGVVAGVRDHGGLLGFEKEMVRARGYLAVSCELVPVALLAAHMGFRLSAVVLGAG